MPDDRGHADADADDGQPYDHDDYPPAGPGEYARGGPLLGRGDAVSARSYALLERDLIPHAGVVRRGT
jgi:hypothetical protein